MNQSIYHSEQPAFVEHSVYQSISEKANQQSNITSQSIFQLNNESFNELINQSINQSIWQSITEAFDRPTINLSVTQMPIHSSSKQRNDLIGN